MVERTDPFQSKAIGAYKLKSLNVTMCRVLIKLLPTFGEFPHHNVGYLSKVLSLNSAYITEILDFLFDRDVVSYEDESYYLSQDNLWRLQDFLNVNPFIILKRRLDEIEENK